MSLIDIVTNPFGIVIRIVLFPSRVGDATLKNKGDDVPGFGDKQLPKSGQVGDFPTGFGEKNKDVV